MADAATRYTDRSVIARLAAALIALERWSGRTGVEDPAATALLDILWRFPTVGGATFAPWHEAWTADPLRREIEDLEQGREAVLVARVQQAAAAAGVSPVPLLSGLLHASEIVGDNLFKAVDHDATLTHLRAVRTLVGRDDVDLPDASRFPDQSADDFHGWGNPVDDVTVRRWRGLV